MRYTLERREAVLRKMLPPHNKSIPELAREEGISEATLYNWRKQERARGRLLPDGDTGPAGWNSADKFAAVVETAAMNEAELGEYCRKRGLFPEQVKGWRAACEHANDWERAALGQYRGELRVGKKHIRELERELTRKDKALAETAALLVLRKKAEAIWGSKEEE